MTNVYERLAKRLDELPHGPKQRRAAEDGLTNRGLVQEVRKLGRH